jgi:hypothetical protein
MDDVGVVQRWPVYVRLGDQPEVHVGDAYADGPADLMRQMAALLREAADHMDRRAADIT